MLLIICKRILLKHKMLLLCATAMPSTIVQDALTFTTAIAHINQFT